MQDDLLLHWRPLHAAQHPCCCISVLGDFTHQFRNKRVNRQHLCRPYFAFPAIADTASALIVSRASVRLHIREERGYPAEGRL